MNLKIKITLETKRLLRLRRSLKIKLWCAECGMETDFVSESEIQDVLTKPNLEEKTHKILTEGGQVLICLESLLKNQS